MIYKISNRFKDTTMIIKGESLCWEDHIIQISNISQIWLGNYFKERIPFPFILILFFIALASANPIATIVMLSALFIYILTWAYRYWKSKDTIDIHIKVASGNVYSFVTNNNKFTNQVYDLLCYLISQNKINPDLCIRFCEDGKIIKNNISITRNTLHEKIINQSTESYSSTFNNYHEVIDLLKTIIQLMDTGNKKELSESSNENNLKLLELLEEFKTQVNDQFYDLLNQNNINANLNIRLQGDGHVTNHSITIPHKNVDRQLLSIQSIETNNQIIVELQKLAIKYASDRETIAESIDLIEQIIQQIEAGSNEEELLALYKKFIHMGLLKDCNGLKLLALIESIRNTVYC